MVINALYKRRVAAVLLAAAMTLTAGAQTAQMAGTLETGTLSGGTLSGGVFLGQLYHDLGTVSRRHVAKRYTIRFRNTGDRPLLVDSVVTNNRNITVSAPRAFTVQPGKRGAVSVTLSPKGDGVGAYNKILYLYCEGRREYVPLYVVYEVK